MGIMPVMPRLGWPDFPVNLLGRETTQRTASRRLQVLTMIRAAALAGLPEAFCSLYELPRSFSASHARHGLEPAALLCFEWSRKMQYFYNVWLLNGGAFYEFTEADVEAYEIDTQFFERCNDPECPRDWWAAATRILTMRPRNL